MLPEFSLSNPVYMRHLVANRILPLVAVQTTKTTQVSDCNYTHQYTSHADMTYNITQDMGGMIQNDMSTHCSCHDSDCCCLGCPMHHHQCHRQHLCTSPSSATATMPTGSLLRNTLKCKDMQSIKTNRLSALIHDIACANMGMVGHIRLLADQCEVLTPDANCS